MINSFKTIISFVGTIFFLYIAFKNIDLSTFWISLKSIGWTLFVIASLMAIVSMVLRAWRWRILLRPLKEIPFFTVFTYTMIGFMANNVLPAHAGEVLKPYLLGKKEGISGISILATVLIERLLDSFALILLFLLAILSVPLPGWLKMGGAAAGIGSLTSILILILLASKNGPARNLLLHGVQKLPQKFRRGIQEKLEAFLEGLQIFRRWRNLLPLFGISLLTWTHLAFTIYIILKGYPLNSPGHGDLFMAAVVTIVFLAFAIVLPSSPGYIGITQIAFKISLGFFAIKEMDAVGSSVIFNLTEYLPITVGGLILLLKEGLSFKYLKKEAAERAASGVTRDAEA